MRTRILSHWFGWYHADRDIGDDAREALSRGCTHGIEHRGHLIAVFLPGAAVGNVAPELENEYGEPVAVDDCDYCGDDGYTDHDEETEDGGLVARARFCDHCVKGLVDRYEHSGYYRKPNPLPPSVAAYLNSQLEESA